MIVTAVLVSHDGERWLPAVLEGLAEQHRPPDRVVAVDTGSRDASFDLVSAALGEAPLALPAATGFPTAVARALASAEPAGGPGEEWIWLLHDDARPAPDALATLVAAAEQRPDAALLGPKLREWPSLRRLLELGLTITGTGRRETGLERGEYDQGQHDEVREVLAVNTAGLLVRREVWEALGGLDDELPVFGNDLDLGWRAARAGHRTLVVPQAVLFHAEAAQRGLRRTELTGRHPHLAQRRAAVFTLLANVSALALPWQALRLTGGTLLRSLGLLLARAPGEALDEIVALVAVLAHPRRLRAARRDRALRRGGPPRSVRGLLAPVWLPYRHGLDAVVDIVSAAAGQAQDVAERRRAARSPGAAPTGAAAETGRRIGEDEEDDAYLRDTGLVARFLTSPIALVTTLFVVLALVATQPAWGAVSGGALSPAPLAAADWWRLHVEAWHPLGTGTDVPAPAYVAILAVLGVLATGPAVALSLILVLAVPVGMWGAWRLLRVVGHLADPRGLPRWLVLWGAATYALVPVTSGAWGQGRLGTVVVAALLPWTAHAALGFLDPEADRRWRACWRTALLLAVSAAFVPGLWLFALLVTVLVLAGLAVVARSVLGDRSTWGPPVVALLTVPVLLAPWLVPLLTTGSAAGLLLEAGRLPVEQVDLAGLLTGRLGTAGGGALAGTAWPWWLGGVLGLLAVAALIPRTTRAGAVVGWVVMLAAAVVVAVLGNLTLDLPAVTTRPSLGFLVVALQGVAVLVATLGATAYLRRLGHAEAGSRHARVAHPWWQRAVAAAVVALAALVPLGGLGWWLIAADDELGPAADPVVPAYMVQSSLTGDEHGVLVLTGSVEDGVDYRVRRGDGTTVGEDEILALTPVDRAFDAEVQRLVSAPTAGLVSLLGERGVEYVVLPDPVDGRIAAGLDATAGLLQASPGDGDARAWRVDRPLAADAVAGPDSLVRTGLLVLQGAAVLTVAVLAGPTLRGRRA